MTSRISRDDAHARRAGRSPERGGPRRSRRAPAPEHTDRYAGRAEQSEMDALLAELVEHYAKGGRR